MNSITGLTPQQLRRAADLKERIDGLQNELNELLGSSEAEAPESVTKGPKKRKMSAAGRARISAAAKARWAKLRKAKAKTDGEAKAEKPTAKKKSKFSPAAKARLSELAKARWAKAKAQGKAKLQ